MYSSGIVNVKTMSFLILQPWDHHRGTACRCRHYDIGSTAFRAQSITYNQERLSSVRSCFPIFFKHQEDDCLFLRLDALFVGAR